LSNHIKRISQFNYDIAKLHEEWKKEMENYDKKSKKKKKSKSSRPNRFVMNVVGYETVKVSFSRKIYYKFNIQNEDKSTTIMRTYKEIKELHSILQRQYPKIPSLPPHRSFGKKTVASFHSKVSELNIFFEKLLDTDRISSNRDLVTFCIPKRQDLNVNKM